MINLDTIAIHAVLIFFSPMPAIKSYAIKHKTVKSLLRRHTQK